VAVAGQGAEPKVGRTVYRAQYLLLVVLAAALLVTVAVIALIDHFWVGGALAAAAAVVGLAAGGWPRVVVDDAGVEVRNLRTRREPWSRLRRVGVEGLHGSVEAWQRAVLILAFGLADGSVRWAFAVRQRSRRGWLGGGYAERVAAEIADRSDPPLQIMAPGSGWATDRDAPTTGA
jgi:hypothetical protein